MKKILAFTFLFCATVSSYAQNTYPWPSTGNIGIGTGSTPASYPLTLSNATETGIQTIYNGTSVFLSHGGWSTSAGKFGIGNGSIPTLMINTIANGGSAVGNVGIGTTSPTSALQIGNFGSGGTNSVLIPGIYNFEQLRFGQIGNGNGALEFVNHAGSSASYGIKLLTNTDSAPGFQLQYASPANSYNALAYQTGLYMNLSGYIGIGTMNPDSKLTVNGTIHSRSVIVDANIADYVFEPAYKLPPLSYVESFIKKNQHLPEIPSQKEVVANGINVGEMNRLLVQKIEELTLYMIKANKRIASLEKKIAKK